MVIAKKSNHFNSATYLKDIEKPHEGMFSCYAESGFKKMTT